MAANPPAPARKDGLRIDALMGTVALVALMLGWGAHQYRSMARVSAARTGVIAWRNQILADNPSVKPGTIKMTSTTGPLGASSGYLARHTSPTGRPITIEAEISLGTFGDSGRVVISAEGRSVTWPIEDALGGRTIDLKAEFPEAFR